MKIFFDTEFTSLIKNTTLISIGMITENNKTFYAEFTDYDESLVDEWIYEFVIKKLQFNDSQNNFFNKDYENNVICRGNKLYIRDVLKNWLESFNEEIEFVSDVCHYDMVLLIDLLADSAIKLPSYINPACHDINQDIAKYLNISEKEAFDKTREDLIDKSEIKNESKHNSLFDAKIIKLIYEKIK